MTSLDQTRPGGPCFALPVLHALRLKGLATASIVTGQVEAVWAEGPDVDGVEAALAELADRGLVSSRGADEPRWVLSAAGRAEGERLLAAELDAAGQRPAVQAAYRAFRALNPRLLDLCSRWQVIDVATNRLNDHVDPDYDRRVITDLIGTHREARPLTEALAAALERFAHYGPRLSAALARVEAGERDWFTGPLIASYHTLWFELHEDLLATLGLDRAEEATGGAHPALAP